MQDGLKTIVLNLISFILYAWLFRHYFIHAASTFKKNLNVSPIRIMTNDWFKNVLLKNFSTVFNQLML